MLLFIHVLITFYLVFYVFIQREKKTIPDLLYVLFSLSMFLHWIFTDGHCIVTYLYKKQYKKKNNHTEYEENKYKDPVVFLDLQHFYKHVLKKKHTVLMKDCGSTFVNLIICFSLFIIVRREHFFHPIFIVITLLLNSLFNIYMRTYYYNKKNKIKDIENINSIRSLKIIIPFVYLIIFINIYSSFSTI